MVTCTSPVTRRRLDIQGFEAVSDEELEAVLPWNRLAFGLCTAIVAGGTALAAPAVLLGLVPVALLGAAFPVHPFDLLYNHGIRRLTGTPALPRRGAPARFACGLATVWLATTAWAFSAGHATAGYVLGGLLVATGTLVSTTDICIPSLVYRTVFGFPPRRG